VKREMEVRGIENNPLQIKGVDRSSLRLKDLAKAKIKRGRIGLKRTDKIFKSSSNKKRRNTS